jgi:hypothetical protein
MRACSEMWLVSQPAAGAVPPLVFARRMKATVLNCPDPSWLFARSLAHDRRTVVELPRRPAKMSAELSPLFIEQARLRPFERPLEAVVLGLAGIDLHAVGDHLEQQRGPLRRRYRRFVGVNRRRGADEQDARHGAMNQFPQFCLHQFGMDARSAISRSFASAAG